MTAVRQPPEPSAEAMIAAAQWIGDGTQKKRLAVMFDAFAARKVAEAVAAERERCAVICRQVADDQYSAWAEVCETRIRNGHASSP